MRDAGGHFTAADLARASVPATMIIVRGSGGGCGRGRGFQRLLLQLLIALGAVLNHFGDGCLDPVPMVFLRHGGGGLVDACMRVLILAVVPPRDFVLHARLGDDLLVSQHQLVPSTRDTISSAVAAATTTATPIATINTGSAILAAATLDESVVPHRGAESVLFRGISVAWILAGLEVILDPLEAPLVVGVLLLVAQVAAVDDGVDEVALGLGGEVAAAGDPPDALEAQRVPDAARSDVGLVDEVENGVGVALFISPRAPGVGDEGRDDQTLICERRRVRMWGKESFMLAGALCCFCLPLTERQCVRQNQGKTKLTSSGAHSR